MQHQQKSIESNNDEPLFRRDMKEIQNEALKNYNKQATVLSEASFESKRYDTMTSSKLFIPIEGKREATAAGGSSGAQQSHSGGNFLSIFSRIVNVFKTPFARKSQIKDNNQQPIQITSTASTSKNEYKEYLINENDQVVEQDVCVFTIDGQDPAGKGLKPKVSKMSSGKTQRDFTPKEVAKMRKSKTANDVNKSTSGWKCCLF